MVRAHLAERLRAPGIGHQMHQPFFAALLAHGPAHFGLPPVPIGVREGSHSASMTRGDFRLRAVRWKARYHFATSALLISQSNRFASVSTRFSPQRGQRRWMSSWSRVSTSDGFGFT